MFSHASVILFTIGEGGHAWLGGAHMAGRHALQGSVSGKGACLAGELAIAGHGTHPTGMHSCYNTRMHSSRKHTPHSSSLGGGWYGPDPPEVAPLGMMAWNCSRN